jgi:hypothetical protein
MAVRVWKYHVKQVFGSLIALTGLAEQQQFGLDGCQFIESWRGIGFQCGFIVGHKSLLMRLKYGSSLGLSINYFDFVTKSEQSIFSPQCHNASSSDRTCPNAEISLGAWLSAKLSPEPVKPRILVGANVLLEFSRHA